jgi:hypothetical protein
MLSPLPSIAGLAALPKLPNRDGKTHLTEKDLLQRFIIITSAGYRA